VDSRHNYKIFVVILNWNNYGDTFECLASIKKIPYTNYEIVLVDNGSTDGSAYKLREEFPDIHVIFNPENLGFAAGCNMGIRYGLEKGADAILLINNDAILEPSSFEFAVDTLFSDKKFGIVGGKIKQYYNPNYIETTGTRRIIWPIISTKAIGAGEMDRGQYDKREERIAISGCLMLIKKEVFEIVGLLPEEYFFGCEDVDFCLNTRKKGFKIIYEPKFIAYHKGNKSSGKSSKYICNYFLHRNLLINRLLPLPILWRFLLFLYFRFYVYRQLIKREKFSPREARKIKKSILLAFRKGFFLKKIDKYFWEKCLEEWEKDE